MSFQRHHLNDSHSKVFWVFGSLPFWITKKGTGKYIHVHCFYLYLERAGIQIYFWKEISYIIFN